MKLLTREFYTRFSFPNLRCLCNNCLFINQIKLCLCFEKIYDFSLSLLAIFKELPHNRRLSPTLNDTRANTFSMSSFNTQLHWTSLYVNTHNNYCFVGLSDKLRRLWGKFSGTCGRRVAFTVREVGYTASNVVKFQQYFYLSFQDWFIFPTVSK